MVHLPSQLEKVISLFNPRLPKTRPQPFLTSVDNFDNHHHLEIWDLVPIVSLNTPRPFLQFYVLTTVSKAQSRNAEYRRHGLYEQTIPTDSRPEGDLTLQVGQGNGARDYLVCSRTLARASPFFRALLYGPFLEGRHTDGRPWQVALTEDDPDAAETILQVVYALFDKPPNECRSSDATVDRLYAILVFVEKYDMRKVLRPWIQDMVPDVHTFQRSRNYPALITIVHELGLWEALDLLLRRLALDCSVNNESELIQPDGSPFRLSAMSLVYQQMVLDNIVGIREHFVESAFKLIREYIYLKDNLTDDFRVAFPEVDRAITSGQDSQALGSQYQGSVDQILRGFENAADNFCIPSEFHLLGPCLGIILRRLEDQILDHEINLSKVQEEYLEWRREEVGVERVPGCEGARRTVPQLHAGCGCLKITFNNFVPEWA